MKIIKCSKKQSIFDLLKAVNERLSQLNSQSVEYNSSRLNMSKTIKSSSHIVDDSVVDILEDALNDYANEAGCDIDTMRYGDSLEVTILFDDGSEDSTSINLNDPMLKDIEYLHDVAYGIIQLLADSGN